MELLKNFYLHKVFKNGTFSQNGTLASALFRKWNSGLSIFSEIKKYKVSEIKNIYFDILKFHFWTSQTAKTSWEGTFRHLERVSSNFRTVTLFSETFVISTLHFYKSFLFQVWTCLRGRKEGSSVHSAPHRYNKHFVKRNKHLKVFAPKINFLESGKRDWNTEWSQNPWKQW